MSPILIIEDDPSDVAVAMRAFRKHRLDDKVEILRDGQQAIDLLRESAGEPATGRARTPRVIFLDLKMPRVDGFEVLRELRENAATRAVPVVVVSSSNREADVRESYRLGANSFLVKRFEPGRPGEFMVDAARYWLDLNRVPEPARRGD